MAQKNETTVLVASLLITTAILGGGGWVVSQNWGKGNFFTHQVFPGNHSSVSGRISFGEKTLMSGDIHPEKLAGIQAIASQNYSQAIASLESYLKLRPNDPEALIYLNNARIGSAASYTIVVSVPIGTDTNPALEILRGVAQAQNQINAAGQIKGVYLKVGIASDDNNPEVVKQIATSLVDNPQVLGVVGHHSSDATLAAGKIYDSGKLVAISPTSTAVKISNLSPYVFRTVPNDFMAARFLANYMIDQLKKKKAVVFYNSQSDYSQSLKSEFTTAVGLQAGQVTDEFDISDVNFSAAESLNKANQQGAEVIMLATNTAKLDQALLVVQLNQKKLLLLGGDGLYSRKTLVEGKSQAVGMVLAVPWHIAAATQSNFPTESRNLWKAEVSWRTATAYDATLALKAALELNPTRSGVQQALSNPDFSTNGATNVVRFSKSGDRNTSVQLVKIAPGVNTSRSGTGFDFEPVP